MGEYQGFFGTGLTVARTLGPLVLTSPLLGGAAPASYAMGPAARRAHHRAELGRPVLAS